jgi:hypothetical protein
LPPLPAACPAIRSTSRGIARIIPRDETYAVDEADFVGHVAEVSIGPLDQGLPGKVRLKDVFGNWHTVSPHAPAPIPRRFRSAPASCWSTATPEASSPFPHPPTSLHNSKHQTGHKYVGTCSTRRHWRLVVLVIGLLFAKLYRRSTRDEAYVRTGLGGQKVVLDGGSVVLPVFHSTAAVNLKTLRLEVARGGPDSLITKDRMRVDIGAEFYVRVKPDASSIALAAQTLGSRTNDAAELRELIEAKFVDGLRSVAATMNLEELQEQRATFVKAVQEAVGADIQNNGLELESVSLTRLDQSDIKHFNPSNFFDAHGLTTLTKITKEREQERNQIVRTTEVNIAQQDLGRPPDHADDRATKREAELAQQRDIANKTAAMRAQTAQVEQTALQNEAEYRIQQELAVANKQTEANQAATPQDRGRSRGQAPQYRNGARPADRGAGSAIASPPRARSNPKRRPSPRPRARWRSRPRKRSRPPRHRNRRARQDHQRDRGAQGRRNQRDADHRDGGSRKAGRRQQGRSHQRAGHRPTPMRRPPAPPASRRSVRPRPKWRRSRPKPATSSA